MTLRGGVAVVTGGGSGLGRQIAEMLAARGAHVVIADRDSEAGRSAALEIERRGGASTYLRVEVTDDGELSRLVRVAVELGPLRALVNNAGGWSPSGRCYPESPPSDWSKVLDLNLRAPMLLTQLFLEPIGQSGGGAIVNISSSGALGPDVYASPEYGAAKAGLIRLTSSLSALGPTRGIRVSCVVPHWIGLARAKAEFAEMSSEEQDKTGGLVDPELIGAEVVRLIESDDSAGHIIALRPGRPPYRLDPAGIDPYWE